MKDLKNKEKALYKISGVKILKLRWGQTAFYSQHLPLKPPNSQGMKRSI
jgi:hypothetical protein